jgi:hypothetical protein
MLHRVRGNNLNVLLISWMTIAGGLLATTRASAAPADSVATSQVPTSQFPTSQVPTSNVQRYTPATSALAAKPKANSMHLYGGLFAPIETNAPSPTVGIRFGRRIGAHLQGGLLVDWTFERRNVEQPINSLPGLQPQLILARADGHLVPAMVFLEVSLTEKRFLVPYGGFAAGYEWLSLKAENFVTGQSATASYANFAWQGWGGMGIRLDQGLRFDFELSYNGGSLERDAPNGNGLKEAVRVNGVGARVGLDIFY